MDFGGALRRAWRMMQLEPAAVKEVAEDREALLPGLLILVIAAVLSGIGSSIVSGGLGILLIPLNIVLLPLVVLVVTGVYHLLAMLFGGKGTFLPLFNALNHGSGLASWLGVVPFLGPIVGGIWGLVVSVVVVREVHEIGTGMAVLVILIPIVVLFCCCALATVLFGATIFSLMASGQG